MSGTVDAILALVAAARTDAGAAVRLQRDGAEAVAGLAAEVRRLRGAMDRIIALADAERYPETPVEADEASTGPEKELVLIILGMAAEARLALEPR